MSLGDTFTESENTSTCWTKHEFDQISTHFIQNWWQ